MSTWTVTSDWRSRTKQQLLEDVQILIEMRDRETAKRKVAEEALATAEQRALQEAADKWKRGEWTVLTAPIKAASSQPQRIIGAAQAVTDWLRARADEVTP